jgi:uncharacterized damage-inducible protein DinB
MIKEGLLKELDSVQEFLFRSVSCLSEEDSGFVPREEMLTVAQHVAHMAQTIEWFMEGMMRPEGFDLDFDSHWDKVKPVTSLEEAKKWFASSIANAKEILSSVNEMDLLHPLPEGPVMGGAPRLVVIGAISDHTAHHRGALTVYSRLLGKTPRLPYMEQ